MKKFYLFALIITVVCGSAPPVAAEGEPAPHVVLAALQTGKTSAAGDDFVEVYNPGTDQLDITGWKLQYRSAAATGTNGWTTKRTVACVAQPVPGSCAVFIQPHVSLLFATYDLANIAEQPIASGFSDVGGQLRLVDATGVVQDMLGYGTAAEAERAQPAPAPPLGLALVRKSNEGRITDLDNNAEDFMVGCYEPLPAGEILPSGPPTIQPCPVAAEADEPDVPGTVLPATTDTPDPGQPASYAPLLITELFPDPVSPQTDSADEFIELYNPTNEPVDASGYVLESGSDFRYHFILGDTTVPAYGYAAVMSAESHLSLTNSGTAVRLLNPAGETIDTVQDYGQAKSGQAWANNNGTWQWTTSPTPNAANNFTAPVAALSAAKKTTATKASAAKTTKASAKSSAASAKASKTAATAAPFGSDDDQGGGSGFNYWLLAPIGVLVAGYVAYEYRHDLNRAWHKTKQLVSGKKDSEPTPQTD